MLAMDLGAVFYGHKESPKPGELLLRHAVEAYGIGVFSHDGRTLIRHNFGLPPTSAAKLATWQHFVIIGMYGQTDAARKVKAYLLERERRARVDDKFVEATGR